MKSFSQLGEDIFVFQNFINKRSKDAIILEIGAYDGVTYSNSLLIESVTGGRSILVEPSPENFSKLVKQRPEASCHRLAIAEDFGVLNFHGDAAVSGLSCNLTDEYKNK